MVVKYDSNGTTLWNGTAGGVLSEYGNDITFDSDNNLIVVGQTNSSGAGKYDYFVIKYGAPRCDDGIDNDRNGLTDCEDPECRNTHLCRLFNKSFTPQPTIVTLQGRLTNTTTGDVITTASMRVTISNSTGQVWNDTFNNSLSSGVFNIPLGASKELNLIAGRVYSVKLEVDISSTTFVTADATFGDGSPASDVIKFTA